MCAEPPKVEKGIPMPSHGAEKYPFDRMEIGDSFTVPYHEQKTYRRIHAAAHKKGYKVVTQVQGELLRVWLKGKKELKP